MKNYIHVLTNLMITGWVFATPTPWSQFHGSVGHEGRWNGKICPSGIASNWSAGSNLLRETQPAVSSDGKTVFAYGNTGSGTGKIYAYDATNGSLKWSAPVNSYTGYLSWSSPVYQDGYVYWAGGSSNFNLYKINASDGSVDWTKSFSGSIVNASPTVADGKVFISTYGGNSKNAVHYGINVTDGSMAWSLNQGGQGQGSVAYDAGRNLVYQTIYTGSDSNFHLRAFNAITGDTVWTSTWSTTYKPMYCSVAYADNKIYFQDYNFAGDGILYVADAANTGNLIRSIVTPKSGDSCPAIGPDGWTWAFGDNAGTGKTRGYDQNGNTAWTFDQGGGWQGSPAWADGYIFTGSQSTNNLYLLDGKTGSIVKSLTGSGPVTFGTHAFYTIGKDGLLYSYDAPYPGDANRDCLVNVSDLGILATNYGITSGGTWGLGDFNGDGMVNVSDLGILATNYGYTGALPTPEPISLSLMLSGGLIVSRKRLKRI